MDNFICVIALISLVLTTGKSWSRTNDRTEAKSRLWSMKYDQFLRSNSSSLFIKSMSDEKEYGQSKRVSKEIK